MATRAVDVEGHILDSHVLSKVADLVVRAGGSLRVVDLVVGERENDPSRARLEIEADDDGGLERILEELAAHGVRPVSDPPTATAEVPDAGAAQPLTWGRKYLMCPPAHFDVAYSINPWMRPDVPVDHDRAMAQWERLVATLREAGAEVELMEPEPGLPDLVFTANAGVVHGGKVLAASFRHPERRAEGVPNARWFESAGFEVETLPSGVALEGAGDALPFGAAFVAGYRTRSDIVAHNVLSELTGRRVLSIELVDPRLYHVDLTFCPLDERRAIVAPSGWDVHGRRVIETLVPDPLVLDDDETSAFCANSVVVGPTVVMPACPPRVGRWLEDRGFDVAVVDVGEFQKAGGAVRCMTLALDVAPNA